MTITGEVYESANWFSHYDDNILTQIVQSQDGSDQTTQVDDQRLIVRLDPERRPLDLGFSRTPIEIGQEVENVLKVVHDLMVHRQLALAHESEIVPNLDQPGVKSLEGGDLSRDPVG